MNELKTPLISKIDIYSNVMNENNTQINKLNLIYHQSYINCIFLIIFCYK